MRRFLVFEKTSHGKQSTKPFHRRIDGIALFNEK